MADLAEAEMQVGEVRENFADAVAEDSAQCGPATVFSEMADLAEEAVRESGISTVKFLAACQSYREFLVRMGVGSFLISDFDANFGKVKAFYDQAPERRSTLQELCADKDFPGVKVSWLLWGMEYFLMFLQKLWEGEAKAGITAYEETLSKHHTWVQRKLATTFLANGPQSKDAICSLPLLLEEAGTGHMKELIDQHASRALRSFGPAVRSAIAICAAAM